MLNKFKNYFYSKDGNFIVGVIGIIGAITGIVFGILSYFSGDVVPAEVVQTIMAKHDVQLSQKDKRLLSQEELNQQLLEVVNVLLLSQKQGDSVAGDALQQLQVGNTGKAKDYFGKWTLVADVDKVKAANVARHAGTVAYLSSVDEAVKIYNESIQLDPNNPTSQMLKSYIEARKASTDISTEGICSPVLKDVTTGDINITGCDAKK